MSPDNTFFSKLYQISTNFDNVLHKDGQDDKIMWSALIFHLTWFVSTHYTVLNVLHRAELLSAANVLAT